MKFAVVLFLCCVSASLQQQYPHWVLPSWRVPFYSSALRQPQQPPIPHSNLPIGDPLANQDSFESLLQSRSKTSTNINPSDRAFGLFKLLGFDYVANYVLNSLSLTTTSTTFTTKTSTLTIGKIVTCFTSSMFSFTTACRRKKNVMLPELLAGEDLRKGPIAPSAVHAVEASAAASIARQDRSFDGPVEIASSKNVEPDPVQVEFSIPVANRFKRNADRNLLEETVYVVTSTVTSYSLYTSSVTTTITGLAATTALSCLPSGATLC